MKKVNKTNLNDVIHDILPLTGKQEVMVYRLGNDAALATLDDDIVVFTRKRYMGEWRLRDLPMCEIFHSVRYDIANFTRVYETTKRVDTVPDDVLKGIRKFRPLIHCPQIKHVYITTGDDASIVFTVVYLDNTAASYQTRTTAALRCSIDVTDVQPAMLPNVVLATTLPWYGLIEIYKEEA